VTFRVGEGEELVGGGEDGGEIVSDVKEAVKRVIHYLFSIHGDDVFSIHGDDI
jgi:hypothetical protein